MVLLDDESICKSKAVARRLGTKLLGEIVVFDTDIRPAGYRQFGPHPRVNEYLHRHFCLHCWLRHYFLPATVASRYQC